MLSSVKGDKYYICDIPVLVSISGLAESIMVLFMSKRLIFNGL